MAYNVQPTDGVMSLHGSDIDLEVEHAKAIVQWEQNVAAEAREEDSKVFDETHGSYIRDSRVGGDINTTTVDMNLVNNMLNNLREKYGLLL